MSKRKTMTWKVAALIAGFTATAAPALAGDGPSAKPAAISTAPRPVSKTQTDKAPSARTAVPERGAVRIESPETPVISGEKRITLQTAGTDIGSALRLVAEQGGLNLVVGPGVEGQVSAYLEEVPVQTALRALAVNNGFDFTVEDGVITVSKPVEKQPDAKEQAPPTLTRIYTLQWQDAAKVKEALEFALTPYGKIKVLNENSEGGYQRTSLSDLGGDLKTGSSTRGPTARPANFSSGGNPPANPNGPTPAFEGELPRNARKLLVTDTRENLELVSDLIADLDRVPPQVLIEARIVEMSTDLQRQLGIDWDVNVLANGPVLNHTLPVKWEAGFAPGNQVRYHVDGTPQNANSLALGTIDFSKFQSLVRIHQTDNAIRLLANPRLLVFNNHSASILVGERYPILQANITDQGTLTEAFDTYIPVGIQLEVTPSIMSDGRITMLVHPTTSSLGDEVVGTTGLRVRRILTREIDTRIIMQDAQTVVLGGLISDRKTRTVSKVPGLGDVPGLNVLFRQESPASQRVDLLVFLTAHVDKATEMSERDQQILELYRPHFKHFDRLQDVPLDFEIPTEYQPAKPMFGDGAYGEAEEGNAEFEGGGLREPPAPAKPVEQRPAGNRQPIAGRQKEAVPSNVPPAVRQTRSSKVSPAGRASVGEPSAAGPRIKPAAAAAKPLRRPIIRANTAASVSPPREENP